MPGWSTGSWSGPSTSTSGAEMGRRPAATNRLADPGQGGVRLPPVASRPRRPRHPARRRGPRPDLGQGEHLCQPVDELLPQRPDRQGPADAGPEHGAALPGHPAVVAQCHNHPFERWTQDDYHGFAAFFARVTLEDRPPESSDRAVQPGADHRATTAAASRSIREPADRAPEVPGRAGGSTSPRAERARVVLAVGSPRARIRTSPGSWPTGSGFTCWQGDLDPVDDFRGSNPPCQRGVARRPGQRPRRTPNTTPST